MKTKKPDIFLGITMCMLVLAAVLCIVILFVQNDSNNAATGSTNAPVVDSNTPNQTGNVSMDSNGTTEPSAPIQTEPVTPVVFDPIDSEGLKAALNDSLNGLTSEWQVMVIDPWDDTKVGSSVNCNVDDWMTANRMTPVFIMGTVFQQAAEGKLTIDEVQADLQAMLKGETAAADRLTEQLGGGDAAAGRETVKAFAVANGLQLGFNRSSTGTNGKPNYVTAQKAAEILSLICQGKLVSKEASAQMLELLFSSANSQDIDTGVAGEGVRTGFIHDVEDKVCICSMGVVQTNGRSFVVGIVCNKPVTTDGAKRKVAELIGIAKPYFEK